MFEIKKILDAWHKDDFLLKSKVVILKAKSKEIDKKILQLKKVKEKLLSGIEIIKREMLSQEKKLTLTCTLPLAL